MLAVCTIVKTIELVTPYFSAFDHLLTHLMGLWNHILLSLLSMGRLLLLISWPKFSSKLPTIHCLSRLFICLVQFQPFGENSPFSSARFKQPSDFSFTCWFGGISPGPPPPRELFTFIIEISISGEISLLFLGFLSNCKSGMSFGCINSFVLLPNLSYPCWSGVILATFCFQSHTFRWDALLRDSLPFSSLTTILFGLWIATIL